MDLSDLAEKLSKFRTEEGRLRKVSDELLFEILDAWEHWKRSPAKFYTSLGVDYRRVNPLLGKAKKLRRKRDQYGFEEIKIQTPFPNPPQWNIELVWDNNKVIRFGEVDLIVEFLRKAT